MAQSPSWEANWFAASQEIPRISRNPKVHYHTHKRPPSKNYLRILLYPEESSHVWAFLNRILYRDVLLAPRPTPQLEDHPLSAVRDCLFNLFVATLHIGGRSSIRNPRTRHAVVTGTHYMVQLYTSVNKCINTFLLNTQRHGTEFFFVRLNGFSAEEENFHTLW